MRPLSVRGWSRQTSSPDEPQASSLVRWLAAAAGSVVLAAGALMALAATPANAAGTYPSNWLMLTHLVKDCPVHENYPTGGVAPHVWHLHRGAHVGVRYNVNGGLFRDPADGRITYTGMALIQDRHRALHHPKQNPHYGFIDRSCLAKQFPLAPLQGVGKNRQPRTVRFDPIGNGKKGATLTIIGNATLRDAAHAFPTGNLRAHWQDTFIIATSTCVVAKHHTWVHGYAPAAHRWGYVDADHLAGCKLTHP
jgi:hypothetical protein